MSQDVTAVLKFAVDDQTSPGLSSASRNLKKNERAIQRVIEQQKKLAREAGKSADQIAIETLKRAEAKDEVIAQVMALQKERQAIMDAKSARTQSINEVDKMIAAMKEQAATINMSSSELAVHKATQKGATAAQIAMIQATQSEIDAKRQASKATVQQNNSADQMIQKLQQEIHLFGKSDDFIIAHKLALEGATQAQINQVFALKSQITTMQKSLPMYQRVKQQLRFIRGGFGQMGHQVQDIAVQLQGGTDAMIVFGQQGSQIASLFGPGGAAIGALLAVGAAAFTVFKNFELTTDQVAEMRQEFEAFTPKTEQAKESLARTLALLTQTERNNLREQISEVNEEFEDAVSKGFLAVQRYEQIGSVLDAKPKAELIKTIRSSGTEAQTAETRLFALRDELVALGGAVTEFPDEELLQKVRDLFSDPLYGGREQAIEAPEIDDDASIEKFQKSREKYLDAQRGLLTGLDKIRSDFDLKEVDFAISAADALAPQEEILAGLAVIRAQEAAEVDAFYQQQYAEQVAYYERIRGETLAREQGIADHKKEIRQSTLDDFEASLDREEELLQRQKDFRQGNLEHLLAVLKREDDERALLAKRKESLDNAMLGQAQNLAAGFASAVGKESKAYKGLFAAQQALAIAQTIINTEAAAVAAQAPIAMGGLGPIAGTAMAGKIRAMGYASVALIAAQTAASFEGGGFTGRGARSGGIDGRGGFPAILHPNETVIDHEGGGMHPVVINQTINVTTGVQQTVRAEIANLLPQISEAAKSAVADSRMRGGNYGSAMGV